MMYYYYFEPGFFQGNDPDVKLRKLNDSGHHTLFYKYCCNPARYEEYAFCFQQEFLAMSGLEEQMLHSESAHVYKRLFPSYYETGLSKKGSPYLITDYIPGCTLEDILSSARVTSPQQILTSQQILQLFQQLDQAQSWLHKAGLIQMDLSPRNIIVCNHIQPELYSYDTLDIRLIDFTDAYYLSSEIRRKRDRWNRRHHLINGLADRSLPPGFMLQQTAALFVTYSSFIKVRKIMNSTVPVNHFSTDMAVCSIVFVSELHLRFSRMNRTLPETLMYPSLTGQTGSANCSGLCSRDSMY